MYTWKPLTTLSNMYVFFTQGHAHQLKCTSYELVEKLTTYIDLAPIANYSVLTSEKVGFVIY